MAGTIFDIRPRRGNNVRCKRNGQTAEQAIRYAAYASRMGANLCIVDETVSQAMNGAFPALGTQTYYEGFIRPGGSGWSWLPSAYWLGYNKDGPAAAGIATYEAVAYNGCNGVDYSQASPGTNPTAGNQTAIATQANGSMATSPEPIGYPCFADGASIVQWLRWMVGYTSWLKDGIVRSHAVAEMWYDGGGYYIPYGLNNNEPDGGPYPPQTTGAWCDGGHAHDIVDVNSCSAWLVGWAVWKSLFIQWMHDAGVAVNFNMFTYVADEYLHIPKLFADAGGGVKYLDSVYGESGSTPFSWTTYNWALGTWKTYYPTANYLLPDSTWIEEGAIDSDLLHSEGGGPAATDQPQGNASALHSLYDTYRTDLAAYPYSEKVAYATNWAHAPYPTTTPELIAMGAVAAKYQFGLEHHHVSSQDEEGCMYGYGNGWSAHNSLAASLAMHVGHWDDMAGVAAGDRTLTPDPPTSLALTYTSTKAARAWSVISPDIVGTHYHADQLYLWVAWYDTGASWTLESDLSIDTARPVELVIAQRDGSYKDCYTWESFTGFGSTLTPGSNNAAAGMVQIVNGVLSLTPAGIQAHTYPQDNTGRVAFKIPIKVGGGSGTDTYGPVPSGMSPAPGQQNAAPTANIAITWTDVAPYGVTPAGLDVTSVTLSIDGGAAIAYNDAHMSYTGSGNVYSFTYNPPTDLATGTHTVLWSAEDNTTGGNGVQYQWTVRVMDESVPPPGYPPPLQDFVPTESHWDATNLGVITLRWTLPEQGTCGYNYITIARSIATPPNTVFPHYGADPADYEQGDQHGNCVIVAVLPATATGCSLSGHTAGISTYFVGYTSQDFA